MIITGHTTFLIVNSCLIPKLLLKYDIIILPDNTFELKYCKIKWVAFWLDSKACPPAPSRWIIKSETTLLSLFAVTQLFSDLSWVLFVLFQPGFLDQYVKVVLSSRTKPDIHALVSTSLDYVFIQRIYFSSFFCQLYAKSCPGSWK